MSRNRDGLTRSSDEVPPEAGWKWSEGVRLYSIITFNNSGKRMNLWNETKSVPVSREMVWAAYKKVKANPA